MTADRDQHGLTREQIADLLAVDDGEPHERTDPQPEPDNGQDG